MPHPTIESLPPELILRCCELRVEHLWVHPRNDTLRALALVSRQWRYPAQSVMNKYVFIKTPACADRLVTGQRKGQFMTIELDLVGNSGLSQQQTEDIVNSRTGTRELRVRNFFQFFESVLYCEALKDLQRLSLENILHITAFTSPAFSHPFSLTSLHLSSLVHIPPSLVASLFLSSPHLASLTIAIHPTCEHLLLAIEASFPSIAPSLSFLSTTHLPPLLLRGCTALRTLECKSIAMEGALEEAIGAMPTDAVGLRVLRTHGREWKLGEEVLRLLATKACQGLEEVELAEWTGKEMEDTEWGKELVEVCGKRGIVLKSGRVTGVGT